VVGVVPALTSCLLKYCKVFDQRVAKQRLGKNLNNRETVFYGIRAATLAMQRRGKYASTTIEAVFSVGSVLRLYRKSELELVTNL
jgi:hypothetical protein